MSKGIVMEKHRNYTIVLTRDGSFQKAVLVNNDAVIGEEVYFESFRKRNFFIWNFNNKRSFALRFVSVAALFAVFIFSTFYLIGENKTYAYVTIDINPSIELAVNKSLQVQGMTAINKDAEKLLSSFSDYKQKDLQTVIDKIMQKSVQHDMANEAKNILIGVSYIDKPQKEIVKSINQYFQTNNTEWEIVTFNVPAEIRQKAAENNSSMNKELAVLIRDNNSDKLNLDEQKKELIHSFYYQETKTKEINQLQQSDVMEPNNINQKNEESVPKADKSDASTSRNVEAAKNNDINQNVNISQPSESQGEDVEIEQKKEPLVIKEKSQHENKHEIQKKNENSHKNNGNKEADDKEKHNKQWKKDKKPNEHGMKMKEKNSKKDNGNKDKHHKNHKDNSNKGNHGKD